MKYRRQNVVPKIFLAAVFVGMLMPLPTPAQSGRDSLSVWVSPGFIIGFSGDWRSLPGLKAGIEGCAGRNMYYEANYSGHANFDFFEKAKANSITQLNSGALLLGVRIPLSGQLSVAGMTGLAYCSGKFRGKGTVVEKEGFLGGTYTDTEFEYSDFSEIGIPVYARALFTGRRIGGALTAYSVIQNNIHYGLMFGAMVRLY